jgi:hypothetical protein
MLLDCHEAFHDTGETVMSILLFTAGTTISWMRSAWLAHLERAVAHAESQHEPPAQADNTTRILLIILIVVVGLPLLCVCVSVIVIAILTLMGPSIGNVFSGIVEELDVTPTP